MSTEETKETILIVKEFIPIITLIVGATIGYLATYLHEKRKEKGLKRKEVINKLEEAFILLENSFSITNTQFSSMLLDKESESVSKASVKLSFILRVNFPNIHDKYKEYLNLSKDYGDYQILSANSILEYKKKHGFNQDIYDSQIQNYYKKQETKNKMIEFFNLYGEICDLIIQEANNYK